MNESRITARMHEERIARGIKASRELERKMQGIKVKAGPQDGDLLSPHRKRPQPGETFEEFLKRKEEIDRRREVPDAQRSSTPSWLENSSHKSGESQPSTDQIEPGGRGFTEKTTGEDPNPPMEQDDFNRMLGGAVKARVEPKQRYPEVKVEHWEL